MELLIVGASGFFGAIARYLIYLTEKKYSTLNFPAGTLLINVFGCLLAGLVLGWATRALPQQRHLVFLVSMGFVGSLTTFSTFSAETFQLMKTHQLGLALANMILNMLLGLLAIWGGSKFFH